MDPIIGMDGHLPNFSICIKEKRNKGRRHLNNVRQTRIAIERNKFK